MADADRAVVETSKNARAEGDPPVGLDVYAAMCAEVDAGVKLGDILAREGVSEEAWATSHAHWLRRMSDEAERKRFRLTTRYQATFKAKRAVFEARLRRERARAERAKVEAPDTRAMDAADRALRVPLVSEVRPLTLPEAPPPMSPADRRGPLAMPSGMRVDPGAQVFSSQAPSPHAQQQMRAPTPPPMVATPAPRMPAPQMPAPQMPPQMAAPPPAGAAPISVTQPPISQAPSTAPAGASMGQSLPFKPAAHPSSSPPLPGGSLPVTPKPVQIHTSSKPEWANVTADISAIVQQITAVPFKEGPPGAPPPVAPKPPAAAAPLPGGKPKHLYATMGIDLSAMTGGALPFQGKDAAPLTQKTPEAKPVPPAPPPPHAQSAAPSEPPKKQENDLGRTGMIDPDIIAKALAGGTPFASRPASRPPPTLDDSQALQPRRPPSSPAVPQQAAPQGGAGSQPPGTQGAGGSRFAINVFASLTAEIAEHPGDVAAIRSRYGVTEAVHLEESKRWTDAFNADPALRERYLGIVKRYRAYLQNNQKK